MEPKKQPPKQEAPKHPGIERGKTIEQWAKYNRQIHKDIISFLSYARRAFE